jgi:hypothetical protein
LHIWFFLGLFMVCFLRFFFHVVSSGPVTRSSIGWGS